MKGEFIDKYVFPLIGVGFVLLFLACLFEGPEKPKQPTETTVESVEVAEVPAVEETGISVDEAVDSVLETLGLEPLQSDNPDYTVKRIVDGDTIIVATRLTGDLRVRLAGIDTPEKGQFYGQEASDHLKELLLDKTVELTSFGKDCFSREVAVVLLDKNDINAQMVRDGCAWAVEGPSECDYSEAQETAIKEHKGLWEPGTSIPPSLYRRLSNLDPDFVKSILEGGFFRDSNGYLHNGRCDYLKKYKIKRWDGVSEYKNCPRCGGAFFD